MMGDEADQAQSLIEADLAAAISHAVGTLRGVAGTQACRDCGDAIPPARRRLLPGATRCVHCQAEAERVQLQHYPQ